MENEQEFAAMWKASVMDRLSLHLAGLEPLDQGSKLRNELTELLTGYATTELLRSELSGQKKCGKKVKPAVDKLKDDIANFKSSQSSDSDLTAVKRAFDALASKLSISWLDKEDQITKKGQELTEMTDTAITRFDETGDRDGSRLFLVVILILLARHQAGLIYATGRFVPRLLKLLKGKVDDERWSRLQELKEEVKTGAMSPKGRTDLRTMLTEKPQA